MHTHERDANRLGSLGKNRTDRDSDEAEVEDLQREALGVVRLGEVHALPLPGDDRRGQHVVRDGLKAGSKGE